MEKQSFRKMGVWIGGEGRNEKREGRSIIERKHKREIAGVTWREAGGEKPVTNCLKRTESSQRRTKRGEENIHSAGRLPRPCTYIHINTCVFECTSR